MSFKFCSIASGSSGNSHYVETSNIRLLIDAGLSGIHIQNSLKSIGVDPTTINGILVTHEHIDHTRGVGILSRRFDIKIYANSLTWDAMEGKLGQIESHNKIIINTEEEFILKDLSILPFATYHDAQEPVGYVLKKDNKKISLLTDTGIICDRIKNVIKNSLLTLIESNHDIDLLVGGRYPWSLKKRILSDKGHLSNESCGNIISEVHEIDKAIYVLGHLSKDNNTPDTAYNTVANIIKSNGFQVGKHLNIDLTHRDKPSKVYSL